ncbi:unnamed protein product [Allacma fusca]|uniref:MYND-type domain-containing protein n=1 Tax=Allacma fusca TaxID=39272 RepID=A0A8J2P5E9_9HEXA|nr:unnamed protein product [Allacma fusca]
MTQPSITRLLNVNVILFGSLLGLSINVRFTEDVSLSDCTPASWLKFQGTMHNYTGLSDSGMLMPLSEVRAQLHAAVTYNTDRCRTPELQLLKRVEGSSAPSTLDINQVSDLELGKSHLEKCECKRVSYCSREHLKEDWGKHRDRDCFPAVILSKRSGGFAVTATRQLLEGQKIIREKPLVLVPFLKFNSGVRSPTPVLCLGCCRILPPTSDYHCSVCKWDLCGVDCEQKKFHNSYECQIFREKKVCPETCSNTEAKQLYWNIAILRCLLSMQREPHHWENMFTLPESLEGLRDRIGSKSNRKIVINAHAFIERTCGFTQFTPDNCEKIFQILWVNSFEQSEVLFKEKISHVRMVYKFAWGFLPSSCCISNARWAVTDPNDPDEEEAYFVARCTMHINKDENIFLDLYGLEPLFNNPVGTLVRRAVLENKYLRPCSCSRCLDPTEWETFLMAVRCKREGCEGYLLITQPLQEEKLLKWECLECNTSLKHETVLHTIQLVTEKLNQARSLGMKQNPVQQIRTILEVIYFSERNYLHQNHFLLLSAIIYVSQLFLTMFMTSFKPGTSLNKEQLGISQDLIPLVKRLYKIIQVLNPGKSQLRGKIMLHLYALSYSSTMINVTSGVSGKATKRTKFGLKMKEKLETILQCHDEVELLLNLEPIEYEAIDFITTMKQQILEDVFGCMEEALRLT